MIASACQAPAPGGRDRPAALPLHLEDHIDGARIGGAQPPKDVPAPLEWRFDKPQPGWKPIVPFKPGIKPIQAPSQQEGALRLTLTKDNRNRWGYRMGVVYIDLADLKRSDWGLIVVEARTKDEIAWISPVFNLREIPSGAQGPQGTFSGWGDSATLIHDGEVHTYLMKSDTAKPDEKTDRWTQFGIGVGVSEQETGDSAKGPMSLDILSIRVIPKAAEYAKSRAGVSREYWGMSHRRTLFAHVPGKVEFEVTVPAGGRLDVGLGLLKIERPAKFKISARELKDGAGANVLFEEAYSADKPRPQRSVDLSQLAGRTVGLALETESEEPGNVAFWGAPTISGSGPAAAPNVVLYIIDGGAAEFMSVYGYNRRTTPHLERLAAEGAIFEHAYSNSSWTKPSVQTFMTSLHHSVLGGYEMESDPLPEQAVPMAERMHRAGYLTEVLTSNPYCGRMSGLDRGVDSMADTGESEEDPEELPNSEELQRNFWDLREAYPGQPYWVHFQPTDVHMPWDPVAPFAGLFATLEERKTFEAMRKKMQEVVAQNYNDVFEKSGVDAALYTQIARKVYDESMAHIDHSIGQLVELLKTRGEWENTLFIVAADHSYESAGLNLFDPKRPKWEVPNIGSYHTWIPMIFVWAGKIPPGRRITQPVSMIDLLPTVLDLAGLPAAEIAQGQSLAPLLLGQPGWTPRPVVFDELNILDQSYQATVDVIDGRWGASLMIDTRPDVKKTPMDRLRPAPLLVFDVWNDPNAFKSLHKERPDLVEKYAKMLEGIWKDHQALAKKFTRSAKVPLTKEQIETLRSLGYIR